MSAEDRDGGGGDFVATVAQAREVLVEGPWAGVLAADEYRGGAVVCRRAPPYEDDDPSRSPSTTRAFTDVDQLRTIGWLAERHPGMRVSPQVLSAAVKLAASAVPFHSLAEEIRAIRDEPRPDLLSDWLVRYGGAEDELRVRTIGRAILADMMWRALRPGTRRADVVAVLRGPRLCGKSRLVEALAGREHYVDGRALDVKNQAAAAVALAGSWLVECDPALLSPRDEAFFLPARERFVGKWQVTSARPPKSYVLVESTSDERHRAERCQVVVQVGERRVDVDGLERDRGGILAAARDELDSGTLVGIDSSSVGDLARKDDLSPMETAVALWLADDRNYPGGFVTVSAVLALALKLDPADCDCSKEKLAAQALRKCGWVPGKRKRISGLRAADARVYPWFPAADGSRS